jgi:hypothetical protein
MAIQPDADRMAALERQRAEWEQQKAEDAAAGELGRDAVADSAAVDDAAEDVYVMYEPHHLKEGKPHPDHVVETTALAGVNPPPVKYEHHLQARVRLPQRFTVSQRASFPLSACRCTPPHSQTLTRHCVNGRAAC